MSVTLNAREYIKKQFELYYTDFLSKKYQTIEVHESDKQAIQDLVDTLIGDDAGKSARTIANEELTERLIPEGAKESLDTLKEIAEWIQKHPDDAAAMANSIAENRTSIEDILSIIGNAETEGTLESRLKVLEDTYLKKDSGTATDLTVDVIHAGTVDSGEWAAGKVTTPELTADKIFLDGEQLLPETEDIDFETEWSV